MNVVLDTNCFISCIGKKSPYRIVFDAFLNQQCALCVSSEMLLEYGEKFIEFWGTEMAHNLLGVLLTAENISLHAIFYNFHLVAGNRDDNRFYGTCLSASSDILVTGDRQLLALGENEFPSIRTMTLQKFLEHLGK